MKSALPQLRENEHRDILPQNLSSDSVPARGGFQSFLTPRSLVAEECLYKRIAENGGGGSIEQGDSPLHTIDSCPRRY
jgi:hypothetical protein